MYSIEELAASEKLKLSAEELKYIASKKEILEDSFTLLSNIETGGIPPLVSVLDIQNVLRDDIAAKMISREKLLTNAVEQENGYFQVPKTFG